MTVLTDSWDEWNKFYKKGTRDDKCLKFEETIHGEQKRMGSLPYDFDSRWEKREKDSKSTITLPPVTELPPTKEKKVPTINFSLDDAKKIVGSSDFSMLEFANRLAEANIVCLTAIANKTNSDNKVNPARRGQSINQSLIIFNDMKSNPEKYKRFKIDT